MMMEVEKSVGRHRKAFLQEKKDRDSSVITQNDAIPKPRATIPKNNTNTPARKDLTKT
jgi:hypothetical protein